MLCNSLVFLIGSIHMLDSELPKQTRLCVLPKIILPGVFIVPSGSLRLVSLIVAVLWSSYWHLLFFSARPS